MPRLASREPLLRRQLEAYIAEERGHDYLAKGKIQTELRKIKKEMADLKRRLTVLETRKAALEKAQTE